MALTEQEEHQRQEREIQQDVKRQQREDAIRARQAGRLRLSIGQGLPLWQRCIIYPVGAWILWDCVRVIIFGGRIHF
jgi:hypothetical protein